jgi:hypothetical protein
VIAALDDDSLLVRRQITNVIEDRRYRRTVETGKQMNAHYASCCDLAGRKRFQPLIAGQLQQFVSRVETHFAHLAHSA